MSLTIWAMPKRSASPDRLRVVYEGRIDGRTHGSWALVNDRLRRPLGGLVDLTVTVPGGDTPVPSDVWLSHYYPGLEGRDGFAPPPLGSGRWVCWVAWEMGPVPRAWEDAWRVGRVAEVWACSAHARRLLLASTALDPAKVRVMPYGVDPFLFAPEGPALPRQSDAFRVLYVGGALPRKGCDLAVTAYCRAFAPDEPTRLVLKLQGAKTFYATAPAIAAPQERTDYQVLDGDALSDAQMGALYRSVDVLVAPYRAEGFCLPLLEAMASRLPVVYPAHGPGPEFVPPGAGIRVASPGGEPSAGDLARALRWLWKNPDERAEMGAKGRAGALDLAWSRRAVAVAQALQVVALSPRPDDAFQAPRLPAKAPPRRAVRAQLGDVQAQGVGQDADPDAVEPQGQPVGPGD